MIERDQSEFEEQNGNIEQGNTFGDQPAEAIDFNNPSDIFLSMRAQNIELLKVAAQVTGVSALSGPLKPNEIKNALKNLWEVYSELYEWIDPEEIEDDEEDDDEEDED
ncbi:hypothetical protein Isop_1446 [Isosphaera pallida ATCC 43644]|jgi:hypothetical protein|uniref:Uncharacterized protein n=1 Tax=Isosphaera pallida (strain ATCC 43644 / DSM 9630 / IS1B) TaxID=575540 RepID=E8QY41_ISOPI|nr:hypothetical protein [Isosphaera pallida]ADV62031.1 hypothetical protein Isop_1446 [Isosphaera pallida ATCC 43644]